MTRFRRAAAALGYAAAAVLGGGGAYAAIVASLPDSVSTDRWVWTYAATVVAATLAVLTARAGGYRLARARSTPKFVTAPDTEPQDRLRDLLISRVRKFWITDVLDPSLAGIPVLTLNLRTRTDLVLHPAGDAAGPVDEPVDITSAYDQAQGGLLVTGQPGSGKSTLVLELARSLLDEAALDEAAPVPIVLNVSPWKDRDQDLVTWTVGQISAKYQVPRVGIGAMIAAGQIVLIFDGVDEIAEVHRGSFVSAVNALRSEIITPVVACIRLRVAESLDTKFSLIQAAEILPLDSKVVRGALRSGGRLVPGLRAAARRDDQLTAVIDSPLIFRVAATVYEGKRREGSSSADPQARLRLGEAYVEHLIQRANQSGGRSYSEEQLRSWMGFLARETLARNSSVFSMNDIQSGWASARQDLIISLVLIVSYWVAGFLFLSQIFGAGILSSIVTAVGGILFLSLASDANVPFVIFSRTFVRYVAHQSAIALGAGVATFALAALLPFAVIVQLTRFLPVFADPVPSGAAAAMMTLTMRMFYTYPEKDSPQPGSAPSVWRMIEGSLASGACVAAVIFALMHLPGLNGMTENGRDAALLGAFTAFVIAVALDNGAFLTVNFFWRTALFLYGDLPLLANRFLRYAADNGLLVAVGPAYQFQHVIVAEYFLRSRTPPEAIDSLDRHVTVGDLRALGWAYLIAGDVPSATAFWRAAEARKPDASSRYALGVAAARLGDEKQAQEFFRSSRTLLRDKRRLSWDDQALLRRLEELTATAPST